MEGCDSEDQISTFWKKITKPLPGRPRAIKEIKGNSHKDSDTCKSFQSFQESVNDAWEIRDEELCYKSDTQRSLKTLQSTARNVTISQCGNILTSQLQENSSSRIKKGKNCTVTIERGDSIMVHNSHKFNNKTHGSHSLVKDVVEVEEGETVLDKLSKFQLLLESNILDLNDLRHLSWSGIPAEVRPKAWRLLAGYLPLSLERRQVTMERKRLDYWNLVKQYFDTGRDETFQEIYRQIQIDIPRMSPLISLFKQKTVQEMFERILFIWAIRHPASSYVQGINDLVTPFYVVFLQEFLPEGFDIDTFLIDSLSKTHRDIVEADSFWCLSKFLDGIQDNYIFAQLGIQHKVNQLKELIQRIDNTLHQHLQAHRIDYLQFSFRWMNNLLTREFPLSCSIRLWDTYLAESDGFASFHLYVCVAFLLHWREQLLLERDFQGVMLMLQKLPTHNWTEADIDVIVADAYRLKFTFADVLNHLQSSENKLPKYTI